MQIDIIFWFYLVCSLAFGLVIGSFLNVVIVRLPEGRSIVRPPSHCVQCKKPLPWHHNIPVLSYLFLRGKCGHCGKEISIRYPIIELLTGLLFVADGIRFGWSPSVLVRDWPFLSLLIVITFIDLEHRVIPDTLSLGGLFLGLATSWLAPDLGVMGSFEGAALGFFIFYTLAWVYQRMRGRLGLGGGDIKLLAMIGAFLGPAGVLFTICVSSIFGSAVGLIWGLICSRASEKLGKKKVNMMQFAIPFGPFLVVGALVYYFLGDLLWYLYMRQI